MSIALSQSDPPGSKCYDIHRTHSRRRSIDSTRHSSSKTDRLRASLSNLHRPLMSTSSEITQLELPLGKQNSYANRTVSTTSSCTEPDDDSSVSCSRNPQLCIANNDLYRENILAMDAWDEVAAEYHKRVEPFTSQFLPFLLNRNILLGPDNVQADDLHYLRGRSVLDVAAGTGAAALYAVSKGAVATASDFSQEMLSVAKARARRYSSIAGGSPGAGSFECRLADGENLPTEWTDRFDVTCSNFGVIYFSDMFRGLNEMVRCTKPGGQVCLSAWGRKEMSNAFRIFPAAIKECGFETKWQGRSAKPSFFFPTKRISANKHFLHESLQDAGLSDVKVIGPFSRDLRLGSAEDYWYRFVLACPNVKRVVEHFFSEKERLKLKETVIRLVNEEARGILASIETDSTSSVTGKECHDVSLSSFSTTRIVNAKSKVAADSGATHHLWPDYSAFVSYKNVFNKSVSLADKSTAPIMGIGDVAVSLNSKKILIRNVYHVPTLKAPLYSLGTHRRLPGCGFVGTNDSFQIMFPKFSLTVHDGADSYLEYSPLGKKNKSTFDYIEPHQSQTPIANKDGSIVLRASAFIAIGTKN